jgi:PAS domain S-box-containing protein
VKESRNVPSRRRFWVGIVSPAVLTIALFLAAIFAVLVPALERTMMERKREMIRELTNSAWSFLAELELQERTGELTREKAQRTALLRVKDLRYGREGKDYFWITDMRPKMIMHPYREELNDQDLTEYRDPKGKALFVEFVHCVKEQGAGYAAYDWQWKDDSTRIVPKLSYVKGFAPWGWIIGTGVYLDDVEAEIAAVTRSVGQISLGIALLVALLLGYQGRQGWLLEIQRRRAESGLRESEAKYRALVEAATEGLFLCLAGKPLYANPKLAELLGCGEKEFLGKDLSVWLPEDEAGRRLAAQIVENRGESASAETRLRAQNGAWLPVLLSFSPISISGRDGVIVTVKDLREHKEAAAALDATRDRLAALTENLNIGLFRADLNRGGALLEMNATGRKLLGLDERENIGNRELSVIFSDAEELRDFLRRLREDGTVKNRTVLLPGAGGAKFLAVTAGVIRDEQGARHICEGLLTDITGRRRLEEERERLAAETHSALLQLNRPLETCVRRPTVCVHDWPAQKAAALMSANKTDAVLVVAPEGEPLGIVTDHDLRERLVARSGDWQKPVRELMSAPVTALRGDASLFEAGILMREKNIGHLAVTDDAGKCVGLLRGRDLLRIERNSAALLVQELRSTRNFDELAAVHVRISPAIKILIDSGTEPDRVTHLNSVAFTAAVERLLTFALNELGAPPASFAFMALGSAGREELTLCADQDNALIYEEPEDQAAAQAWFLRLGERVCSGLARLGHPPCEGGVMAQNAKWCRPLPEYQAMFSHWTTELGDQDLRDVNICFDFRGVYGDERLVSTFRRHVRHAVKNKPRFMFHLAESTLEFKPPVGFFGNIQVEGGGAHAETFNIKTAITPLVNFVRIYALHHDIGPVGTLARLRGLWESGVLNRSTHDEIAQAYNELMRLRLKRQAAQIGENQPPDNHVNPKKLTHLERLMLKRIFAHIAVLQARLTADFARTT